MESIAWSAAVRRLVLRLTRDEEGSVSLFIIPFFILLMFATGLALDLVRYEAQRADLQNALDRGVLAAASVTQARPSATVVQEYVDRRLFRNKTPKLNVETEVSTNAEGVVTSRTVLADADHPFDTVFLNMVGLPELTVDVVSGALEGGGETEISLVLDISGSMAREATSGTTERRLGLLRQSAKDFVNAMLTDEAKEHTSISLIPFAGQVNAGPFFDGLLSGGRVHGYSSCIELPDADFGDIDLPRANANAQVPHFQWFSFEKLRGQPGLPFNPNAGREAEWGWCPSDDQAIVPLSNDRDALNAAIDGFLGHDGTGAQIGMKWGLALLSPATRPTVQALVNSGALPATAATKPADAGKANKIVVIMTDGNTRYQVRPTADAYDTEVERRGWAFDQDELGCCSNGNLIAFNRLGRGNNKNKATPSSNSARNEDEEFRRGQLRALCDLASANDIRIYTIGFDVSEGSNAHADMQSCATTASDFYDVDGVELTAAFDQIAVDIQKLRLVMR